MGKRVTDFNIRLRTIRIRDLIVGIIISMIAVAILSIIFPIFYDDTDIFFILVLSMIILYFAWCLKGTTGLSKNFEEIFVKENTNEILYVFAVNLAFAFMFLFLIVILDFAVGMVDPTWVTGFDIDTVDLAPSAFLLSAIEGIIFAPVIEELVFRGVLFNRLKIRIGIVPAMLISSFLFGIGHDFGGITSAFLFGICMCILYLKTDNILIPMSVHFINNVAATLLDMVNIDAFFSQFPWIILLGIIVITATVYLTKYIINEISALKRVYS